MQSKFRVNELLSDQVDGAQSLDLDMTLIRDASISITYDTATVGDIKLQTGNDGLNFTDITESVVAVVPAGDTIVYEIGHFNTLWLKVVVPAGVTNCDIRLVGARLLKEI